MCSPVGAWHGHMLSALAKVWPCVHPYGTGSLHAEPGSGSMQRYVRNRATNLESFFRRSRARPKQRFTVPAGSESDAKRRHARNNLWAFWKLDQYIKNQLFFSHKRLTQRGGQPRQQQSGPNNDMKTMLFGSVVPSSIPESSTWWKAHAALAEM